MAENSLIASVLIFVSTFIEVGVVLAIGRLFFILLCTAIIFAPFYLLAKYVHKRIERGYTVDIINKKYIHSNGKEWDLSFTDICSIKKIVQIDKLQQSKPAERGNIKTLIQYTFTIPVDANGKMKSFSFEDGEKRNRIVYGIEKATGCEIVDLGCEEINSIQSERSIK